MEAGVHIMLWPIALLSMGGRRIAHRHTSAVVCEYAYRAQHCPVWGWTAGTLAHGCVCAT
jgi:hypothetical protein